jgi:hypothetical protein
MRFEVFLFGSICIDGTTYEYDVVIDRGRIRKRKKSHPEGSATGLGIHRSRLKRRYLGSVGDL